MDANGLTFRILADRAHWTLGDDVEYDDAHHALRLRSVRQTPIAGEPTSATAEADARRVLTDRVPETRDTFGTRARWDQGARFVLATGALPGEVRVYEPPAGEALTGLAVGSDGVLYVASGGRVHLHDLRERWGDVTLGDPTFAAWRLAVAPHGGAWALDHDHQRLGRITGLPLPARPYAPYASGTVRPCAENPDPATLTVVPTLWEGEAVAIASSPAGRLGVLTWEHDADALLHVVAKNGVLERAVRLRGARFPYTVAWLAETTVAVLVTELPSEALVYELDPPAGEAQPVGVFYPLRDFVAAPFVQGTGLPPHYPTHDGTAPLLPISAPSFAHGGEARGSAALDGGRAGTVWHRLYLEAAIPRHCGVRVFVGASETPTAAMRSEEWYEHRFGEMFTPGAGSPLPRGAWVPVPSEIPYHPGLLGCEPVPQRTGLFTALIQRSNRPVRALRGRYLRVRVKLEGDGRATPQIAALRAYASRFSYVEHYLPELYHESVFGPDADAVTAVDAARASTPADFLERFLDNCEGILTPLEDRIANAYLLTDPRSAPDDALEWLGSWIGIVFDPAYPIARRRRLLAATSELYRRRGTLAGLRLALDLTTDGGVSRGQIVVLEDFRLRRTFATILGANLLDQNDPLMPSLIASGNSYVGKTLILGEEWRGEFLALYGSNVPTPAEAHTVAAFLDRLANRVTVLVHQEVDRQDLGLIRRVVELEKPAHVSSQVAEARYQFLVAIASLVGVDTFLGPVPSTQAVQVDRSSVGVRDRLLRVATLDPRLEGRAGVPALAPERPIAVAGPALEVPFGTAFTLNAAGSRPGDGHQIVRYLWTLIH
jgi:phage tail-like protein